jgi:hypothetical protein
MSDESRDHSNIDSSYWRGETNARLKAVEDGQRDLRLDIKTAGEMTRMVMEKNNEQLSKMIMLVESRMDAKFASAAASFGALTNSVDEVKKEVYKILGKAALLGAILLPFIVFLLQRLWPAKGP